MSTIVNHKKISKRQKKNKKNKKNKNFFILFKKRPLLSLILSTAILRLSYFRD